MTDLTTSKTWNLKRFLGSGVPFKRRVPMHIFEQCIGHCCSVRQLCFFSEFIVCLKGKGSILWCNIFENRLMSEQRPFNFWYIRRLFFGMSFILFMTLLSLLRKVYLIIHMRTCWSSISMIYSIIRMTKRMYARNFRSIFFFISPFLPARVFYS